MIDLNEVESEISKLENCGTTNYSVCEKLSILYNVKDHQVGGEPKGRRAEMSFASSEFSMLAMGIPQETLVDILDEHIEAIRTIYPREYASIIRKLKNA